MRNPERIKFVLRELERLWLQVPDWRLGQLVFNIVGRDPFFIEDYDLVRKGFEQFSREEIKVNDEDFPEYYIEPNEMKKFFEKLELGVYHRILTKRLLGENESKFKEVVEENKEAVEEARAVLEKNEVNG